MIPAFVAKSAVRKMCLEVAAFAAICMVALLFAIAVSVSLDAPQWFTTFMAAFFAQFAGAGMAASWIGNKF